MEEGIPVKVSNEAASVGERIARLGALTETASSFRDAILRINQNEVELGVGEFVGGIRLFQNVPFQKFRKIW